MCNRVLQALAAAAIGGSTLAPILPMADAQSHPFTVHDLVAMQRISAPQLSPDGGRIAFVVRSTDLEANRGRTDLWLVGSDGSGLRQLTTHEASDSSPRWAADGASLFFLSTRSGSSQVFRLPMAGGEAQQVTDLPLDVANLLVAPDGRTLAFTLEVFPACETLACTVERLEETEQDPRTGRAFDRLFIRHWDAWKDGRRSHLFTLQLPGADPVGDPVGDPAGDPVGDPVDVTAGIDADVPSKPFGGAEEITFTPDSGGLVFALRLAPTGEPWSTNFDLYTAPVDGSAPPRNLTAGNPAWDTHPVFSPDGGTLAYLAMRRPGYESDRFRLVLRDWASGSERVVAKEWDRSVRDFGFSADGATLLATAADTGQVPLFAIDVASGRVRRLVDEGTVSSPQAAAATVIFARSQLGSPLELYSLEGAGGEPRPLTGVNRERLARVRLGEAEQFSFAGWRDERVYGYLVKPVDFDPQRRYPVAFLIHGGPQGSFGNNFHYRWNPQTYTGAGYAVVMIDFHGSVGYGQAFTDSINDDWGGKPLEDLELGLAAALERYAFLDADRICALGASYGGYMINWIAGRRPERFRCLVNHDGLFDQRMMYYTTEELWFPEWDHRGTYFENPEGHEKHNPARLVDRWRTPMLVVHGALDFRVPETQGLATFTALQRRGIPSRLLYFPDESHWVLKPHNSIQWHEEVLAWLGKWLDAE